MVKKLASPIVVMILVFVSGMFAQAQQRGLNIQAPSHIYSGEEFKIVVTYNGAPAADADITFEGAVMDPAKTNENGVIILTAPEVLELTTIIVNIKHNGYNYVKLTVLPTDWKGDWNTYIKRSITPFNGTVKVIKNGFWSEKHTLVGGEILLIDLKTDGNIVNLYLMDEDNYRRYATNKTPSFYDYGQYNLIEGTCMWINPEGEDGYRYVVVENPNAINVTFTISISNIKTI